MTMNAPTRKGFHLLEEADWDETALIPRLAFDDEPETAPVAVPRHQPTPAMLGDAD